MPLQQGELTPARAPHLLIPSPVSIALSRSCSKARSSLLALRPAAILWPSSSPAAAASEKEEEIAAALTLQICVVGIDGRAGVRAQETPR